MSDQTIEHQVQTLNAELETRLQEIKTADDVNNIRVAYLGRKGKIADLFKVMATLSPEHRRDAGQAVNMFKAKVQSAIDQKKASLSDQDRSNQFFDISLPGHRGLLGHHHPLTLVLREIKSCFSRMGFTIAQGPEVELDYYNFEALNIPKIHPSRDMQDTFYISDDIVLRTHTSPVQVRTMENQSPPVRIIAPGRCFRRDTPDATHSPMFQQVEGLYVDEGVTFADLKGVILTFARTMFGSDMKIRFRPGFFPFTEPSAEYDFSCVMCRGKGCRICKGTGWIEISGAGMVNPKVFEYVNYDPEKYTGYAFGMGVERIAMLIYQIHDIRLFYENDIRFLNQF